MILNIYTGKHYSQMKLLSFTNIFFNKKSFKKTITANDCNYAIHIGKNSVKIILSNKHNENDLNKIKKYIKTLFKGKSILIDSNSNLMWLSDINDVSINILNDNKIQKVGITNECFSKK